MGNLTISNFGPIKEFSGELSRVTVIIGPQASGKSTVAKLFFYLKMLPVWLSTYSPPSGGGKNQYEQFQKILRMNFLNLFGPVYHQSRMTISYSFYNAHTKNNHKIIISQDNSTQNRNYLTVRFDKTLRENIECFLEKLNSARHEEYKGVIGSRTSRLYHEDIVKDKFIDEAQQIFAETRVPFFIPAGRTLLTLLSGQINMDLKISDFIMRDFLNTINDIRPQVGHGLEEIEAIARKTWPIQPDATRAALARDEIQKILKGRYSFTSGEERIYHTKGHTKLSVASSGQQESLWVILVAYMLILERKSVFTVFEEPEAHLYPESQYSIIRLISILANSNTKNQVLITTHSPYVLTSINNLITAYSCGKEKPDEISNIIKRQMWLSSEEVMAYRFKRDGHSYVIMDTELEMIQSEEIDGISNILNDELDNMMNMV